MGRIKAKKEPGGATLASLPQEVVLRLFSVPRRPGDADTFLSLKDRVRCLAVCSAWRRYLDPRAAPVEQLRLEARLTNHRDPIAVWACDAQPQAKALDLLICDGLAFDSPSVEMMHSALLSVHPRAALRRLRLEAPHKVARRFWWGICRFPQLRELELYHEERQPQCVLDGGMLSALRSLESLHVEAWGRVALAGEGVLLPRLERCSVLYCERVEVDTALPRLQILELSDVDDISLCRGRLQLPALTRLQLGGSDATAEVDFSRMPALADLSMEHVDALAASGPLSSLTSLEIGYHYTPDWEAAVSLLRQAPPSLHRLAVTHGRSDLPCSLASVPQLRQLTCTSRSIIPQLRPLRALCELHLPHTSPAELSIAHLERLADLPSLQRLKFGISCFEPGSSEGEHEAARLRMQVLRRAVPEGCTVELPCGC